MKAITPEYKNNIKELGREIDARINYILDGNQQELTGEDLYSVSFHYEGALLKSVMKRLDIVSNNDIPIGTELNYKFGVRTNNVRQTVESIMLRFGREWYENFYYPVQSIEFLRRYVNIGFKTNLNVLIRTRESDPNGFSITDNEIQYLLNNCDEDLTKTFVRVYPIEPIGKTDYSIETTIVLESEPISQDGLEGYTYIDYGNFIVYSSEKQEGDDNYKIVCYDKLIYAMKDYEELNITYPITIRNYINTIANHLGLTFKNASTTFANYNMELHSELYLDNEGNNAGYTFRDVLDEIAQVTASTICIDEATDELEIRYINNTGDEINEEFLKDKNVNFKQKYGPVNSIVLSRAAESDNVYIKDDESIEENGLCEIKIVDNQILNFNDRSDYLPEMFGKLNGLEYYINDFESTGITYYELCDQYNIVIGDKYYKCLMLNDDITVGRGLKENIFTEMPSEAKTDYKKSDKTDRRINQTYIIVDKQNQKIESVVSSVTEQNNKISQITQTVDEINAKISDIADITVSGESNYATFTLENVNESEPIQIRVKPIDTSISYLYPVSSLYPSSSTYLKVRTVRFHNNTTNTDVDYVLPDDLLIYDSENYDEFYLDYDSQTCQVIKRCKYNADGSVGLLASEQIVDYPYPEILLEDGNYTLTLLGYEYGYLFVRLMAKNIYTTQFYTKVETDSRINQKASEIELGVSQTLTNYSTTAQMNSAINIKANEISSVVSTKVGSNEIISKINQSAETITINASKLNLTGYITASDLSGSGTTTINGANITTGTISADRVSGGTLQGSTIIATSGTIGGWNILATRLRASNGKSGISSSTFGNDPSFWAGYGDPWEHSDWATQTPFYVTQDGFLKATNATISGDITATSGSFTGRISSTSGSIAGWTINSTYLSYGGDSGNNGARLYRDGRIYMKNNDGWLNCGSGGTILNGNRVVISDQIGTSSQVDSNTSISLRAFYGHLHLNSNVAVYANNTLLASGSSKNMKTNIKPMKEKDIKEIFKEVKELPLYTYDYKKKYSGQKDNYGIIIEDFENKLLGKVLHVVNNKEDKNIKNFSHDDLNKVNLIVIKQLINKIEFLENKVSELEEIVNE